MSAPAKPLRADTTFNGGETTVSTGTDFGTRLTVASTGTATLSIVAGAYATNTSSYVGLNVGSFGTAKVLGGTWANSDELSVGYLGTGVLNVTGGRVTNPDAYRGDGASGIGAARVSSGTSITSGSLAVGASGTGPTTGVLGVSSLVNNGTLVFIRSETNTINMVSATSGTGTLTGGTIRATSGISLGVGANVAGRGGIAGLVSAAYGSRVEADGGKLTVDDSSSYVGFASCGWLSTSANEVEFLDRNLAVLGSLTQLGDGSAGGTQPGTQYDRVVDSGVLTMLGGTLNVTLQRVCAVVRGSVRDSPVRATLGRPGPDTHQPT